MNTELRRTDLPTLILHNVDRSWEAGDIEESLGAVRLLKTGLAAIGHPVEDLAIEDDRLADALASFDPDAHIVFNWCEELPGIQHGDVRVAEILESRGFTYTGATPRVLALSWEKTAIKSVLQRAGVPTPRWRICVPEGPDDWESYPAIVKPAAEHSSIGITTEAVVLNADELRRRVRYVWDTYRQPALVEDFIDGREFHVTVWGNGRIEMLPPAEMDFTAFQDVRDRLCTYDAKFAPDSAHYQKIVLLVPAALDADETDRLREIAFRAYRAVGCRDYARLDLRLRDGVFYVLDVNPNADLSPDTSLAYAAEAAGYSYGEVGSRLVNLAAGRHPRFGRLGPSAPA